MQKPVSASKCVKLQKKVHEMCAYFLVSAVLNECKRSQCKIVEGVLCLFCWPGAKLLDLLPEQLLNLPKPFRPVLKPMGAFDVAKLERSGAYSAVLPPSHEDADWRTLAIDGDIINHIKRAKANWMPPPEPESFSSSGQGDSSLVKHLLTAHGPRTVASSEGVLYLTTANGKESKLLKYDFHGKELECSILSFNDQNGMAIVDDLVVASYPDRVIASEISGNNVRWKEEHDYPVSGLSMSASHVYYCVGHSVVCLDPLTMKVHRMMGQPDQEGCGCISAEPLKLLLHNPSATAVIESCLFVADSGNKRVLCWDMMKNESRVVFKGKHPSLLAADNAGLCIYDEGEHKMFHVSVGTWEIYHFLGNGIEMFSPPGLPPLSTSLLKLTSMAIGHDRELAFICEDDDRVLTCRLPSFATHILTCTGPMSATHEDEEAAGERENALVPLQNDDLQPTCGAKFQSFSAQPSPMILSAPLPSDQNNVSIKWTMLAPKSGSGICLVADHLLASNRKSVDCHLISSPEWGAKTCITTISETNKMAQKKEDEKEQWQKQPFRKCLAVAMDKFKDWMIDASTTELAKENSRAKPFHFRDQNNFEALVERSYDEQADCLIWKLVSLKINGQVRAGALEPIHVGVDVKVRICVFVTDVGVLECGVPKVTGKPSYM